MARRSRKVCRTKKGKFTRCRKGMKRHHVPTRSHRGKRSKGRRHSRAYFDRRLRGAGCRSRRTGRAAVCPPGVGRGGSRVHHRRGRKGRTAKQMAALRKLIAHNRSKAGRAKLARAARRRARSHGRFR